MLRFNQGAFVRVTVSADDVAGFARRWPCFGDIRGLSFTFQRSNGDLVDLHGDHGMDPAGVSALADDAKAYAAKGGLLPPWCVPAIEEQRGQS